MEYRRLGKSGLNISEIGLGGNTFGLSVDEAASNAVISHALDSGINYIDTADWYNQGLSEEFIGKAVKGRRARVIIATKFGMPMGTGPNDKGGSRHHVIEAANASLKRLQSDYIDLYQLHNPDPATPIEETLYALDDLVRSGRVRYIGCSNFAAWQLSDALWTSRVHHLQSFVTVQTRYNILERQIELELVPCCQAHGVGVIPWGPLAGGFLTGKYRKGDTTPNVGRLSQPNRLYSKMLTDANWDKLAKLEAFAAERGHKVSELAIAWLLAHPWLSTVIAGERTQQQISANVAAAGWKLTAAEVAEVSAITSA